MAKKIDMVVRLPQEQLAYIHAVAKLAGVSHGSVLAVLLAVQIMRGEVKTVERVAK